jgi:hypothetical protein
MEVCGKAVKLALFFMLCSLGVSVYDEWFSLGSANTQLHSCRVTMIMWRQTAISRPLSATFLFERPPFRAQDTVLHLSDLLPSLHKQCC